MIKHKNAPTIRTENKTKKIIIRRITAGIVIRLIANTSIWYYDF